MIVDFKWIWLNDMRFSCGSWSVKLLNYTILHIKCLRLWIKIEQNAIYFNVFHLPVCNLQQSHLCRQCWNESGLALKSRDFVNFFRQDNHFMHLKVFILTCCKKRIKRLKLISFTKCMSSWQQVTFARHVNYCVINIIIIGLCIYQQKHFIHIFIWYQIESFTMSLNRLLSIINCSKVDEKKWS